MPSCEPLAVPPQLAELLEDQLVVLRVDPGPGVGDRHLDDAAGDLAPRCRRARPAGVNLTAFDSRLKTTWRSFRSSARIVISSRLELEIRARFPPGPPARRASSRRSRGRRAARRPTSSSSILPASTLDRSRMSLITDEQVPARVEHVVHVAELPLVELAVQLLLQELREADDRVQRRSQLVRHVGQELRLVAADGLELLVQRAAARRSSGSGSRRERRARRGSPPRRASRSRRPRSRPGAPPSVESGTTSDQERTSPSRTARTMLAAPTPISRLRDATYALRFCAIECLGLRARPHGESVRQGAEVVVDAITVARCGRTLLRPASARSSAMI